MKAITRTALCTGIWLSLAGTAPAQDLVLVEDGKSPYRIMVAVDATMQAYYAAQQLQRYVKEMTGAELPIVGDDNARQLGASGMIGIGESLRVWAGQQGLAW